MALRRFIPWPDNRLRTAAKPVGKVTDDTRALWDDLLETMYAMPGVGMAAPQIGILRRVAVVDCSDSKDQPLCMADPEVLHLSEKFAEHDEASPNLPGVHARIKRPRALTVTYLDQAGLRVRKDFVGLWAVSVQHQIDHLNGRMYFDNLSPVKRRMLLAKARKMKAREG